MTRLLLAVLALLLLAAPADAAVKKSIWGPASVDGVSQFPIYKELGVDIWQVTVRWDQIAPRRPARAGDPADPAYRWPAGVDAAVAEAAANGIEVSVLLIGAPEWANGGRKWYWSPDDPDDFAAFAAAASRRWTTVTHWMIWSEPTKAANWQPLEPDRGRPLRGAAAAPARKYARLLDRSYVALKGVTPRNRVIGGNTYTTGTVAPLRWARAMKLRGGRPPRMDFYGHNPFSLRPPRLKGKRLGYGYADFGDLDVLRRVLRRHQRRAGRTPRIFISEYTLPTSHRNHEFNFFVTEAKQAEWIRLAIRTVRRTRWLYAFGYLGLYDDPLRADGQQVERGLLRRDGSRKPAFSAYAGA